MNFLMLYVIKDGGYFDKPIVIYNIDNYYKSLIEMLEYSIEKKFGKENYRETYKVFDNVNKRGDQDYHVVEWA